MEKKERNSSLELLRIIAIILIFWMHGASSYRNNQLSAWLCIVIETIGNIGVSLFVLISGYFGIRFKPIKMIQLDMMILFYCWIGLLFRFIWGEAELFESSQILSYIFPIIGRYSWYFTCYFALVFLSPFLNDIVEKLDRKTFKNMLIMMLVIFSGITTFCFFDITQDGGKGIVNMVLLYLVGRYIHKYKDVVAYSRKKLFVTYIMVTLCCILLNAGIYIVTGTVQNRFARDNSLFTIAEAVCIFLIFKSMCFNNIIINKLARHVPAIFIMEWTLRGVITQYIFDYLAWRESNWHEVILLGISFGLFVMGVCINTIRLKIFGTLENKVACFWAKKMQILKWFIFEKIFNAPDKYLQ